MYYRDYTAAHVALTTKIMFFLCFVGVDDDFKTQSSDTSLLWDHKINLDSLLGKNMIQSMSQFSLA